MSHVMVDLETLGQSPGCTILSIGAVAFDYATQSLGPEFYTVISRISCRKLGFFEDAGTVAWWSRQSEAARNAAFGGTIPIEMALAEFSSYVRQFGGNVRVWGCGSDFDNAILGHAYRVIGSTQPWRYYNNRCYRTLKNLVQGVEMERSGTHHNALADAKSQAVHAMRLLSAIAKVKP